MDFTFEKNKILEEQIRNKNFYTFLRPSSPHVIHEEVMMYGAPGCGMRVNISEGSIEPIEQGSEKSIASYSFTIPDPCKFCGQIYDENVNSKCSVCNKIICIDCKLGGEDDLNHCVHCNEKFCQKCIKEQIVCDNNLPDLDNE